MAPLCTTLRISPVTLMRERPKTDMECGGKVMLPPSLLTNLMTSVPFRDSNGGPMLFKIALEGRSTHCGVLEFTAEEGFVNAPSWVLDTLQANVGDVVQITAIQLPKATFMRVQPQSTDFLDISDPRAVLENHLRGFACLTENDIIPIFYNNKSYMLKVEEIKPAKAVCINECDMEVDFSPPVGYVDPSIPAKTIPQEEEEVVQNGSTAFTGVGHRLDGKKSKVPEPVRRTAPSIEAGHPDFDYKLGTINFLRPDTTSEQPQTSRSMN